jgi:antitoxin FitA
MDQLDVSTRHDRQRADVAPIHRCWRQIGATVPRVPSVQVKGVPEDVHRILRQRAAAAGQSLQEYLLGRLVDDARTATLDEVLDRAGGRAGGKITLRSAARAVRNERDAR